jgi:hypothetical protein
MTSLQLVSSSQLLTGTTLWARVAAQGIEQALGSLLVEAS